MLPAFVESPNVAPRLLPAFSDAEDEAAPPRRRYARGRPNYLQPGRPPFPIGGRVWVDELGQARRLKKQVVDPEADLFDLPMVGHDDKKDDRQDP